MKALDNYMNELVFEEIVTDEFYGDGWYLAGVASGIVVGGLIVLTQSGITLSQYYEYLYEK